MKVQIEQINTLAFKIHKFGEDKKTEGFFGAIGFGGRVPSSFLSISQTSLSPLPPPLISV